MRDGKIFDLIDKKIGNTAEKLAQKCALDAKARTTLSRLIQENQIFSQTFKQTALGHPPAIMHGIQESEGHIWEGITKEYTPLATQGCAPKNEEIHKKTGERLKNITDI